MEENDSLKGYTSRVITTTISSVFDGTVWKTVAKTAIARAKDSGPWEVAEVAAQAFDKIYEDGLGVVGTALSRMLLDIKEEDFKVYELEDKNGND